MNICTKCKNNIDKYYYFHTSLFCQECYKLYFEKKVFSVIKSHCSKNTCNFNIDNDHMLEYNFLTTLISKFNQMQYINISLTNFSDDSLLILPFSGTCLAKMILFDLTNGSDPFISLMKQENNNTGMRNYILPFASFTQKNMTDYLEIIQHEQDDFEKKCIQNELQKIITSKNYLYKMF